MCHSNKKESCSPMANVLPSQSVESGQKVKEEKKERTASASMRSAAERNEEQRPAPVWNRSKPTLEI